jgi:hypothetical protein
MNAMGAPDTAWVRSDHPLSGAVLRVDIRHFGPTVDVRTPDGGSAARVRSWERRSTGFPSFTPPIRCATRI